MRQCVLILGRMTLEVPDQPPQTTTVNETETAVNSLVEEETPFSSGGDDHALVFMVAGLHGTTKQTKWRQAFSYRFDRGSVEGEKLKEMVTQALDDLKEVGLEVVALTGAQDTDFDSLLRALAVTVERPYLDRGGGRRVFVFSDAPHLLESTRRCLMRCKVESPSTGMARWSVIRDLYDIDRRAAVRACPKVNEFSFRISSSRFRLRRTMNVRDSRK